MNLNAPDTEILRSHVKQTRIDDHNNDRVFVIHFRAARNRDAIHELKGLLKIALRRHGFRCVSVTTEGVERSESAA